MDTFTSLLAGVITFAILGNLAHELNLDVEQVVQGGTGLAFSKIVAYNLGTIF
jgi:hypothetical protein